MITKEMMAISFRDISIGMLSSMILLSVKLSKRLDRVIYEPEQFPALIYKTREGPTCLIYASCKIVVSGAKSEDNLSRTTESEEILHSIDGQIYEPVLKSALHNSVVHQSAMSPIYFTDFFFFF
jgi:TATA-box binding protein (TBP) (component of TFIID and TFIIIB)